MACSITSHQRPTTHSRRSAFRATQPLTHKPAPFTARRPTPYATHLHRLAVTAAAMPTVAAASSSDQTKVLFVCLGNICRSPSAEAVFRAVVERAGAADHFSIDSCGTGGGSASWYLEGGFSYHEGDAADPRMTKVAAARGVRLTSRSRPLTPADMAEFDVILGMDDSNIDSIKRAARHWEKEGKLEAGAVGEWEEKVGLMTSYLRNPKYERYGEVPDPYYGGEKGFELVLDLLDDACEGLLATLEERRQA